MAETISNGKTGLADLSIDEIFTRYSVHSVKSLHREYHASVNKAKADLHSLVGNKYRDLIQIAEDIDKMHHMSKSIDDKLTDLSYKPSSHVSFGNNSYAKFDTKTREKNANEARIKSRTTIFNNIVNNQLLSFDLKLQSSAHINSRLFVHMAKVYFTIESIFTANSPDEALNKTDFIQYKERFNTYLENKIAMRLPDSSFLETNIFINSESQWLESDSVDFLDTALEDDQEENSDDESFDDSGSKKYFGGSSSPMSNYIVAYIIINNSNEKLSSLEHVARKIDELRFEYLKNLVNNAMEVDPRNSCNINFSFIIAFSESTYSCIKRYFLKSGSSDLVSSIRRASTWKAHDFIGFHNWFSTETIALDSRKYSLLDDEFLHALESKNPFFAEYIFQVFTQIVTNLDHEEPIKRAERALSLLHNFVAACRKAEVIAESNDSECLTIASFSWFELPHKLLDFVVSFIRGLLSSDNGFIEGRILGQIKTNLDYFSIKSYAHNDLFERDFINLIDEDFEQYFGKVLELSSSNSKTKGADYLDDASFKLKQWFNEQKSLSTSISTTDSSLVTEMIEALKKPYSNIKPFNSWGSFDTSSCKSRFSEVVQQRQQSLIIQINRLLCEIISILKTLTNDPGMNKVHYILNLVHLLKTNSSLYSDKDLDSKMQVAFQEIFEQLFHNLQRDSQTSTSTSYLDLLDNDQALHTTLESGTVPLWPHVIVNSSVEQISKTLLSSSYLSSYELFDIFSCKGNKAIFVKVKNDWISRTLIESKLVQGASKLIESVNSSKVPQSGANLNEENENSATDEMNRKTQNDNSDETANTEELSDAIVRESEELSAREFHETAVQRSQLSSSKSRQLMANIAFLLCFVSKHSLTAQNDQVRSFVEQVNALSENKIEESTLDIIIRGANEFYKSSRNIHLPLSVN